MLDNKDIQNHWNQIKPQVLAHWNKLNEAEVEKTHGNASSLGKLVHAKYGFSKNNFEREYEEICNHVSHDKGGRGPSIYAGKTKVMKDLSKNTIGEEGFNENLDETLDDDIDEAGITRFDNDHSADYTGFKMNSGVRLSEKDQEELMQPDLKGMEASEAELPLETKINETGLKQNTNTNRKTASDEFKPNHDPSSSQRKDITTGRSNSSANTTSPSALTSSEATKKL